MAPMRVHNVLKIPATSATRHRPPYGTVRLIGTTVVTMCPSWIVTLLNTLAPSQAKMPARFSACQRASLTSDVACVTSIQQYKVGIRSLGRGGWPQVAAAKVGFANLESPSLGAACLAEPLSSVAGMLFAFAAESALSGAAADAAMFGAATEAALFATTADAALFASLRTASASGTASGIAMPGKASVEKRSLNMWKQMQDVAQNAPTSAMIFAKLHRAVGARCVDKPPA
mmetsp:Transcript_33240/g.95406  ORF Transcript_33240/g.95406 Transcript_33240/m.95406 type:complete len:230 (+) Transcript_33240:355-1044(+)